MRNAWPETGQAAWTYCDGGAPDLVELGTVVARDVSLPAHFHDEDQITFAVAGRRRLLVGGEVIDLEPGGCALIPAGTVHRSIGERAGAACLNLYVPAADYALDAMIEDAKRLACDVEVVGAADLMTLVRRHRLGLKAPPPTSFDVPSRTVSASAARKGMSREGFSRAFTRSYGMPPHTHALVTRLNLARRRLRAGHDIVDVALGAGFADQSHFGRWFRKLFGTTPGRFKTGWARSQTFQTRR